MVVFERVLTPMALTDHLNGGGEADTLMSGRDCEWRAGLEPSSTAPNMMREREWTRLYMHTRSLITRASGKVRRLLADQFGRRTLSIKTPVPIVSFTFDDAPVTAFREGRGILKQFGARATYYVSLGLLDAETEVGRSHPSAIWHAPWTRAASLDATRSIIWTLGTRHPPRSWRRLPGTAKRCTGFCRVRDSRLSRIRRAGPGFH